MPTIIVISAMSILLIEYKPVFLFIHTNKEATNLIQQ